MARGWKEIKKNQTPVEETKKPRIRISNISIQNTYQSLPNCMSYFICAKDEWPEKPKTESI
eukprot:scaffold5915_cov67-Cyclotella_meneghiniana.AAC.1